MKTSIWLLVVAIALIGGVLGGTLGGRGLLEGKRLVSSRRPVAEDVEPLRRPVAEGVIFYALYKGAEDRSAAFTRANTAKVVPGGSASCNVNAYGKLYRDFLVISYPDQKDLDVRLIPCSRLISIRFGHGGIKTVESQ